MTWPAHQAGTCQRCPRCGEFSLGLQARIGLSKQTNEVKVKLAGWVRDQNMYREAPEITLDRINLVAASPLRGIVELAERLLGFAIQKHSGLGKRFDINDPVFAAVTYSQDNDDVGYLMNFCIEQKWLTGRPQDLQVTPHGYMRHEQLGTRQTASAQGFIAMWFDESLNSACVDGFETGIRDAGYRPMRIDRKEHAGKIDDEIIAEIRRSRFVVADFTGHRGGVYFEAGLALGLKLPVIWTCRQDELSKLHFDIRQFNCIDWSDPKLLAERLRKRIEAVIGAGPHKPLPS